MEYWDIYDDNRNKTGRTILRSDRDNLGENENHVAIHVAFFNSKGEMLLQRRSLDKVDDPGKWDFSSRGSILVNETAQDGAHRETLEELGIDYDFSKVEPAFTMKYPNVFDDFFIIKYDIDIDDIVIQKEELDAVMWGNLDKIIDLINNNQFAINDIDFIKYIFELYKEIK
jgi:isopentenyldiphosphate isomerase